MVTWKEKDNKHLRRLLDEFLVAKDRWKHEWGNPNRYKCQKDYRKIEDELFALLPDNFSYKGFVFVKGFNATRRYVQIFTEQSFSRSQKYVSKLYTK